MYEYDEECLQTFLNMQSQLFDEPVAETLEEEGTYSAGHYADDVPDEVKQRRLDALMSEQEEISLEVNRAKVGHNVRVIIDREEADYYVGRTEYDSPEVDPEVLIEKTKPLVIGEFYDATITSAQPFELFAVV